MGHRYAKFNFVRNIYANVELKRKFTPAFLCLRESERYDFSEICVLAALVERYFSEICIFLALVKRYDFSEIRKYVCCSFTSMITMT